MSIFKDIEYRLDTPEDDDLESPTFITADDPNRLSLYFNEWSDNGICVRIVNGVWNQVDFTGNFTFIDINNPQILSELQKMYEQANEEDKIKVLLYAVADFIISTDSWYNTNHKVKYNKLLFSFNDIKIWCCSDADSNEERLFKIEQDSVGKVFLRCYDYEIDLDDSHNTNCIIDILLSTIC